MAVEDQDKAAQLAKMNERRSAVYGLMARLYNVEVDAALLDELRGRSFPSDTGNADVDKGYGLIARFMSNVWDNTLTELAVDYVRTFIGHGMDMYSAAYPYESVYTSKTRLLMQEARDEVMALYHAAGIVKADSWKEGEDHIALELEYMQILAGRTASALREGREEEAVSALKMQRNFIEDHLGAWSPMFTADGKKYAKTDLYQGLAYLTDGFLAEDRAFLDDLLGQGGCASPADGK